MSLTTDSEADSKASHPSKVKKIVAKIRHHHHHDNKPREGGENLKQKCLHIGRHRRPSQQGMAIQVSLQIWEAAYDALKTDSGSTGLVLAYENIISQELCTEQKIGGNEIPSEQRLEQMTAIASSGLKKVLSSKSNQVESAREILISARDTIDSWLAYYPSAALAWAGFCTLTPLLLEPFLAQQQDMKTGLIWVTTNISHFMAASQILLRDNWESETEFARLHIHTRQTVLDLYRKLLEFEMNCVCAAASAWNFGAKNVVDWNGWAGMARAIHDADEVLRRDMERYGTRDARERLERDDNGDADDSAIAV